MIWLLTRGRKNKFTLYCPAVYGMDTWGSDSQDSLEKKRKNWYICCWHAGGEWYDDTYNQYKLNVVLETPDITEVQKYLYKHNVHGQELKKILDDAKEMFNQYISFSQWGLDR